jgi:hypothetical protein
MKPTIITLTPSDNGNDTVSVSSFEEAFGEFSEARGRGRQRRAKRKAERQKNRQTKRMTRIQNRAERKGARQNMRAQQQEARQMRKDTRKSRKVARKSMGEEEEGAELQNQDGGIQDEGATQSEEQTTEEQGGEEQGGEDMGSEGGEDMGSEGGEDMGSEGGEEESGFDGDDFSFFDGDDFYNAESDDYFVNADGDNQPINPKVKTVAQKIEDGKEYIASLQTVLANTQNDTDRNRVNAKIYRINNTLSDLEASLEGYSSARGRGKQERNRRKEVKKAKRVARKNRVQKSIRGKKDVKSIAKSLAKMYPPAIALQMAKKVIANKRANGGDETPVDVELNPEFSENEIVVPASEQGEGANGQTGLIGMDNQQDFDAPEVREFDLTFSGADGSGTKINLKALAIGVGVGILAIYLIKRYKLLGNK